MSRSPSRHVWALIILGVFLVLILMRRDLVSPVGGQSPPVPAPTAADFGQWTFIGPTYLLPTSDPNAMSGRVTSAAADPADPNHWLAGAAMGGVWETHDAGVSWQPRTDGQPSLAMGAIAFSPTSPNVVYAGTGEANFSRWAFAGAGMLRSDDSGATWSVVNTVTFARASVKAILVHPADPDIVIAGTARGYAGRDLAPVASPPMFGIHKSADGGRTWTRTLTGQVSSLVRHPGDFSLQYAAIGDPNGIPNTNNNGDLQPGTMPNGVYRTTDTGEHWMPVAGPWTSTNDTAYGAGYIALAIAPSNPAVMYASVELPSAPGGGTRELLGLFRTNNAWADAPEWIQVPIVAVRSNSGAVVGYCDQCGYAHVLSVDPTDPDTLFAGGEDLWRCRSCAATPAWVKVTRTTPQADVHVDHHDLTWSGNRLIDVNDGGVYSSIDRGATWRSHNMGLPLVQFFGGAVHPTRTNLVVGNTQDNLLDKWTGGGAWERLFSSVMVAEGQVLISASHPDTDWAITHTYRVVARTTDGGRNFQQVQAGIDFRAPYQTLPYQTTLRACPGNDDVVFVGGNRLWRTNNFFSAPVPAWSVNGPDFDVSSCVAPGRVPATCVGIHAIAFADSDASCNTYALGTGGGFLRVTANGGASWSDFDPSDGVPNRAVTGMAFAKNDPNVAYVTLSGFDEGTLGKPGHVFKTTNALSPSPAWKNVTPPVNLPFNTIVSDPAAPNIVYAGTDNALWASRDGGATWAYMGPDTGLPNTAVFDLQIQASTGKVFAFTFGRGAFALTPSAGTMRQRR